jgi:REP element-mobilizing transposase RayT
MGINHSSRVEVYVHLVWATWNRQPFLTRDVKPRVFNCIRAECAQMKADVVALGGVEDHMHALVRLPATQSISSLVKQIKGSSSHLVNHTCEDYFKWQGGYGAFSVSRRHLASARDYVLHQEERHRTGSLVAEFEPG